MLLHGVEEGFPEGSNGPFHTSLLVARAGIAQADLDMVMAGEFQKAGIILDFRAAFQDHGGEVIVPDGMGNSREGGKGQEMTLDKELERAAGEEMGEQIPRVAQEKDEAVEFSQLGMMDKTPIGLRFFPW